jgi:hypothetical protein
LGKLRKPPEKSGRVKGWKTPFYKIGGKSKTENPIMDFVSERFKKTDAIWR